MQKLVAIDSGKSTTKAIAKNSTSEIVKFNLSTKMVITSEKTTTSKDNYVIGYKGKYYLIGNKPEKYDFETSKALDLHKISIFTAISQLADSGDTVKIGLGCPMSIYNDYANRQEFQKFMFEEKNVNIEVNGKPFTFAIDEISIFPETSGIILKNYEKYGNKVVGVIDIGGLNVNGAMYDGGDPMRSTCFTINEGGNVLIKDLRDHLGSTMLSNLNDAQVKRAIKDGYIFSDKEKSSKIIQDFLEEFMQKILDEAIAHGWDLFNTELIFTGGGSILLKKQINKTLVKHNALTISDNGVWDNVEGFGFVIGI